MKNKKDLYYILIFAAIVVFCLAYLFQSSYAKYRRGITGDVEAEIASWHIKVNGEDIMNNKTLTTTIVPTFLESENTKEGVIAPGVEGYYTVTVDASDVDVNFLCMIKSEVADESSISDLKTLSYEINPTDTENRLTYSSDTGIVYEFARNSGIVTFKIYLVWDDENGQMDNQADTSVGVDDTSQALMKVNLQFSQVL